MDELAYAHSDIDLTSMPADADDGGLEFHFPGAGYEPAVAIALEPQLDLGRLGYPRPASDLMSSTVSLQRPTAGLQGAGADRRRSLLPSTACRPLRSTAGSRRLAAEACSVPVAAWWSTTQPLPRCSSGPREHDKAQSQSGTSPTSLCYVPGRQGFAGAQCRRGRAHATRFSMPATRDCATRACRPRRGISKTRSRASSSTALRRGESRQTSRGRRNVQVNPGPILPRERRERVDPSPRQQPGSSRSMPVCAAASAAQRAAGVSWVDRRPKESCPKCGGELREADERFRITKGGFRTRKACQAAMTQGPERRSNSAPSCCRPKTTVRDVSAGRMAAGHQGDAASDDLLPATRCWCKEHVIPRLGSMQLQKLTPSAINALYAYLGEDGRVRGERSALGLLGASGSCRSAPRLPRRRALGTSDGQPGRCRRSTQGQRRASDEAARLDRRAAWPPSCAGCQRSPLCPLATAGDDRHAQGRGPGSAWDDLDMEGGTVTIRRILDAGQRRRRR